MIWVHQRHQRITNTNTHQHQHWNLAQIITVKTTQKPISFRSSLVFLPAFFSKAIAIAVAVHRYSFLSKVCTQLSKGIVSGIGDEMWFDVKHDLMIITRCYKSFVNAYCIWTRWGLFDRFNYYYGWIRWLLLIW